MRLVLDFLIFNTTPDFVSIRHLVLYGSIDFIQTGAGPYIFIFDIQETDLLTEVCVYFLLMLASQLQLLSLVSKVITSNQLFAHGLLRGVRVSEKSIM